MNLNSEQETREAIADWQKLSDTAQTMQLRKAIEKLELNEMYYEQKGNDRGVGRCRACLELLREQLSRVSPG